MPHHPSQILPLRADQLDEAGAVIARAFQDYPLMIHTFPDPAERARQLLAHQTWIVHHGYCFGHVAGVGDPLVGVTVAFPPDDELFSEERKTQSGFYRLAAAFGLEDWLRADAAMTTVVDYAEEDLARVLSGPHWSLEAIAVEPPQQNQGLGGLLLEALHAHTDADGRPIMLLTHDPRAVPFYQRHGYDLVCTGTEPTSGLRHWGLRRVPHP